jgi:hypothetical protein
MDTIKPLFTATATAIGGRNGHTETSDGIVSADLSVPKEMGGPESPKRRLLSISSPQDTRHASAELSITLRSSRRRMRAKPRSLVPSRSVHARVAASGSPSRCASRTGVSNKPNLSASCRRLTRRFAPIRTQRAAMLMSISTSSVARAAPSTDDRACVGGYGDQKG